MNFTIPTAADNSGMIARTEVRPEGFHLPVHVFQDTMVEYLAYDFDGNVAICQINITVMDGTTTLPMRILGKPCTTWSLRFDNHFLSCTQLPVPVVGSHS